MPTLDQFLARLDAIRAMPDRHAGLRALQAFEAEIRSAVPTSLALLLFSARYAGFGAFNESRRCAEDLLALADAQPHAVEHALRGVGNLFAMYGQGDERLVERALPFAATTLRRDAGNPDAMMIALMGSFYAERWSVFARLRRRFLRANAASAASDNAFVQFLAMCEPDWDGMAASDGGGLLSWSSTMGATPAGPVVATACDGVYWRYFGDIALASLRAVDPRRHFHAHLVDPDEATAVQLRTIAATDPAFSFAIQSTAPAAHLIGDPKARKAYYSCARFIALESQLRAFGQPMLLVDVDIRFRRSLAPYFREVAGAGPRATRHVRLTPWFDFGAGFCFVEPDRDGFAFARGMRRYILDRIQAGQAHWHLDQIAMYFVDRTLGRGGAGIRGESYMISRRHLHFAGQFIGALSLEDKRRQMLAAVS